MIVAASAGDGGHNVGLWTGDTLTLRFDQAVAPVAVATTADVLAVVDLSPALTDYCPAADVSGVWQGGDVLVLTFAFRCEAVVASSSSAAAWAVGAVSVTAVGFHSAIGTSPASSSSVRVNSGRCGRVLLLTVGVTV